MIVLLKFERNPHKFDGSISWKPAKWQRWPLAFSAHKQQARSEAQFPVSRRLTLFGSNWLGCRCDISGERCDIWGKPVRRSSTRLYVLRISVQIEPVSCKITSIFVSACVNMRQRGSIHGSAFLPPSWWQTMGSKAMKSKTAGGKWKWHDDNRA